MTTIIKLKDIDVESLSPDTLNLVSKLAAQILTLSGKSVCFNDPYLLLKLRRNVKKLNDKNLTRTYYEYKRALLKSVNKGHFRIRDAKMIGSTQYENAVPSRVRRSAPRKRSAGRIPPALPVMA